MDSILQSLNQTLFPGHTVIRVDGYDGAEKYPMPRDCEAPLFDEDEDYVYIKKTDTNGGIILLRYRMEEDPIPHFDPKKYVTVDDFSKFKEEILNVFNNLQQTLTNSKSGSGYTKHTNGSNKQVNKPNNGIDQSSAGV